MSGLSRPGVDDPTPVDADPFERWRQLQLADPARRARLDAATDLAVWERLADRYDAESSLAEAAPRLVGWVAAQLEPEDDLLDMGAGTGAFALPLAAKVRSVTAAEPAPAMLRVLRVKLDAAETTARADAQAAAEAAAEAAAIAEAEPPPETPSKSRSGSTSKASAEVATGPADVRIVQAGWEDAVAPHAVVLAVNSLYRVLDLAAWFETVHRLALRRVIVILTDGRQPPIPPEVAAVLSEGRVPPVAGPAELERALSALVGRFGYERASWNARREYRFDSVEAAVARLLDPYGPSEDERARATTVLATLLEEGADGFVLRSEHRVVGLSWNRPR